MIKKAILAELVDALEEQSETLLAFLDTATGEVVLMDQETLSLAEDSPEEIEDLEGWEKQDAELALRIVSREEFLALPNRFEVNEYRIMQDFCDELPDGNARTELQDAISGQRAFRRFKDKLLDLDLSDSWFLYRRIAFEEILRPWCEKNGITLVPKPENPGEQGSLNF